MAAYAAIELELVYLILSKYPLYLKLDINVGIKESAAHVI